MKQICVEKQKYDMENAKKSRHRAYNIQLFYIITNDNVTNYEQ